MKEEKNELKWDENQGAIIKDVGNEIKGDVEVDPEGDAYQETFMKDKVTYTLIRKHHWKITICLNHNHIVLYFKFALFMMSKGKK